MQLDSVTVSLIAAAAAFVGVALTSLVNLFVNHINRHKSFNEWRREKLYVSLIDFRKKLGEASKQSQSIIIDNGLSEKQKRSKIYVAYMNTMEDIENITFLLKVRERNRFYSNYFIYVQSQVEMKMLFRVNANDREFREFAARSQIFTDYVSSLIYNMK